MNFPARQFDIADCGKYLSERYTWISLRLAKVEALISCRFQMAVREADVSQRKGSTCLETWSYRAKGSWALPAVGIA
jgi:hypothetical protein